MYAWCAVLFCLGILAFLDTIFNMGEIFRTVNSILFMLISLGLLVRTSSKRKEHGRENMKMRIYELEKEIAGLKAHEKTLSEF